MADTEKWVLNTKTPWNSKSFKGFGTVSQICLHPHTGMCADYGVAAGAAASGAHPRRIRLFKSVCAYKKTNTGRCWSFYGAASQI